MGERDRRLSSDVADKDASITLSFCEGTATSSHGAVQRNHSHVRHSACLLLGNRIQEVQLFTLSVGKVYPHVSSLVCGGTGPRSTRRNKGGILPYSKEHKQTGSECSVEREKESSAAWTPVLNMTDTRNEA